MRGRIAALDDTVAVAREHAAVGVRKHRAYGHFAARASTFGFRQRHRHCVVVRHRRLPVPPANSTPLAATSPKSNI